MPIMTRMRDNMPVILIGLVVMFVVMIVFEWGMDYLGIRSGRRDYVGIIDGKKITYQEFSDLVKRAADSQKKQTGQDPDDDTYRQIRDQVWNSLIASTLVDRETKRAGITVSDQELVDWVKGDNPPDFLVQQFRDSTGRFNREAYDQTINDPKNKDIMIQVETGLRQQRLNEKMQSLIFASVRVTPGEVAERYEDQHMKLNAQYALFDPNRFFPDSTVSVTDEDLRTYYTDHQDEFKANATRKLKYVLFSDQPSAKDSEDVLSDANSIVQRAKAGIDFLELQKSYSDNPAAPAFFKHGQLSREKEDAVFSAHVGDIVGPVKDYDGYHVIKILDEKKGSETFVRARHLLLHDTGSDESAVMKEANELIARAKKGEDFTELVKKYSVEPGAATSGGELGWFGKGRMVKPFEDVALKGKPGQILGPVKTQFGIHIIKIEGRDDREVKIADITLPIKATSQTKDDAFQRAQDFAYVAKDGKFEKDAESFNLQVKETPPFVKGPSIPGVGSNESVMKFAFDKDLGDISDAYEVVGGVAVFQISEVKKEGVRPFDEVKEFLRPRVLRMKKVKLMTEAMTKERSSMSDTLDLTSLAAADPRVMAQSTGDFSVNGAIPTIGRDDAFAGVAMTLPVGKVSQPVEGVRGCYFIKLLSKTPFDTSGFNAQKNILAAQMLQEKKQRIIADWLEKLREKADIQDYRDQFYR
ncbi:MAG TPA: peptidylprolyl isomerase [Bacteroidota bacterium]|nr:peptidylprolyl isomerase [Bacteroidota bacterium]